MLYIKQYLRYIHNISGCCCRATRTPDQQHSSTTKEQLLWGGGFAPLANAPFVVLLRWLLLLCHSRHGRRPGPQKDNNTAAQQKSSFFGVGLRSARQCAFRGRRAAAARTARTAEQPEQLPPLPSASPFPFPVRFRRLPRPAAVYHSAVL